MNFTSYDLLNIKKGSSKIIDYAKVKALLSQAKPFSKIKLTDEIEAGGAEKVKFDAVVGNPPYQENIGSNVNKSLSRQLYPSFIKITVNLHPEYLSLLTPSRWFTANAQDRSFVALRDFIKKNNHLKKIVNYLNFNDVFNEVNIPGGVSYFLFVKDYNGNVFFEEISDGKSIIIERPLFENNMDVILPMNRMISILQKVITNNFSSMREIVTGRNPFGVPASNDLLSNILSDSPDYIHDIKILCAYEQVKYISREAIKRNHDLSKNWKVFTSKINGAAGTLLSGKAVAILGKTFVMGPDCICSNTLLAIGNFLNKIEATNLNKYMYTKFFRFMLGIKKMAQVLTSNIYQYVPLQNFTPDSDIDWSKSISEIDRQLYAKYNLSDDEIAFIEKMIKPMS